MVAEVHKALEDYALANYEAGGHWVAETFGDGDYAEYLAAADGDVEAAKAALKAYWELVVDREADCAW